MPEHVLTWPRPPPPPTQTASPNSLLCWPATTSRPADQARALHAYANALEAAGRTTDGQAKLAEALTMFDEM